MTCRELNDILGDYRNGELAPDVRSRLEEHLLGCPACVASVRSYRETVRMVKDTGSGLEQLVPADVPNQLVDAILDRTVREPKPPGPRRR